MGPGVQVQGGNYRGVAGDGRVGGVRNQEGWQGRRPPDPRIYNRPPQDQRRPLGRYEDQDQGAKQHEQNPLKPMELRERLTLGFTTDHLKIKGR
jgi:hypothetical protein